MACWAAELLCAGRLSQNDDVALLQCWGELGAHVGLEDRAVHRGVDDPRRGQRPAAQSSDEGLGLPVAKGGLERRRSPLATRPRARVIFAVVPVSSMKTSL